MNKQKLAESMAEFIGEEKYLELTKINDWEVMYTPDGLIAVWDKGAFDEVIFVFYKKTNTWACRVDGQIGEVGKGPTRDIAFFSAVLKRIKK